MRTFVQWLKESFSADLSGGKIKGIKWIYHPKLKTESDQCDPSNHYKYEHYQLIDRAKAALPKSAQKPSYDEIHKGHAYIQKGTAHAFGYHDRVHHMHNNALDPTEVGDHLRHKYKVRNVVWHRDSMDAQDALN